jgi:hypothetical protein
MPITVTCRACNQTVAAPDSMAGKKAVCPKCQASMSVPEQYAPAAIVDPHRSDKSLAEPLPIIDKPSSVDIAKPPDFDTRAEEEKATLEILRLVYIFFRDDWRRLPTCGHLWIAFGLFFLPWVNVSCNNRTLVSQSGLQTCYGAFALDPKFEKWARDERAPRIDNFSKPKLDEPPPWSALSIVFGTFVCLGGIIGFLCVAGVFFRLHTFAAATHLFSLGLGSAAFLALASQMLIGFPIDKHAKQQLEKCRNIPFGNRPDPNDAVEAMLDIEVKYSPWLWLSAVLTLVSVPTFLLEFGVLIAEAIKRHMRQQFDSG